MYTEKTIKSRLTQINKRMNDIKSGYDGIVLVTRTDDDRHWEIRLN